MEPVPPRQARRRRLFEREFKAEIVRLIVEGRRSQYQVAADFDIV
jgi:transposase-like protein